MSGVNKRERYVLIFKEIQFYSTASERAMAGNVLINRSPLAVIFNANMNQL